MQKNVFLFTSLAALGASATVLVSDQASLAVADGDALVVSTSKQTTYPTEVGQPSFWLDCSETNAWTFQGNEVVRIPSKVLAGAVNSRYLTTNLTDGVFSWQPKAPFFVDDGSLKGGFLDFGAVGSKRGLLFDAILGDGCTQATNSLKTIGTVVTVYNADQGGGCLLGGGYETPDWEWKDGYLWNRNGSLSSINSGVFSSQHVAPRFQWGSVLHNGIDSTPTQVGFTGAWEILETESRDRDTKAFAQGLPEASGIGLNDGRANQGLSHGGGMKIAEMLIYDHRLSRDEMKKLEVYLRAKWLLNTPLAGWNGTASAGKVHLSTTSDSKTTTVASLDVPEGETLLINRLTGGRSSPRDVRKPKLVKTGAGKLVLDGAGRYNGTLEMQGGVLAFERRAVPTLAELPTNMVARFDISDESSFTSLVDGGTEYVTELRNLAAGPDALYNGQYKMTLVPPSDAQRPFLRRNALGTGKHTVDFGPRVWNQPGVGRYFEFHANGAKITAPFTTAIAVFGQQDYSGNLLGGAFGREGDGGSSVAFYYMVNPTASHGYSNSGTYAGYTNGVLYVDGCRYRSDGRFDYAGYQTYAHQSMVASVIGTDVVGSPANTSRAGGARLQELILYKCPLSEREILDVQAYLSNKWFDRAIPGYCRGANDVEDDVQKLSVTADATIDVPEGATVTVGELTFANGSKLTKTGAGTLAIRSGSDLVSSVVVSEGSVSFAGRRVTSSDSEIAAAPSMRLDAANACTVEKTLVNGTNFVQNWYSEDFSNYAFVPKYLTIDGNSSVNILQPWIDPDETLNGKPVLDFGGFLKPYVSGGPFDPAMAFAHALNAVRSAYVVMKFKDGHGEWLGASRAGDADARDYNDFKRDGNGETGKRLVWDSDGPAGSTATILTNGVSASYKAVPCANFQLIEVHTPGGAHVSALACDLIYDNTSMYPRQGGVKIAEVVLYERELTDREKVATRNYLMKKWFDAEPQALPAAPVEDHVFWNLTRDCATETVTTVSGNVFLADGAVVNLTNFTSEDYFKRWTVAKGASATAPTGPVTVLVNGQPLRDGVTAKFRADADGNLKVRFGGFGFQIIVR